MGDYEGSTTVELPRDDLFDYLSRIENLPAYIPRMTEAHSLTGDEVSVEAIVEPGDVGGGEGEHTVHGEAWFRIDADARRLEWGSEGPSEYHGELAVHAADGDAGSSQVVVRLHTLHEAVGIQQGLDQTLENIRQLTPSDVISD